MTIREFFAQFISVDGSKVSTMIILLFIFSIFTMVMYVLKGYIQPEFVYIIASFIGGITGVNVFDRISQIKTVAQQNNIPINSYQPVNNYQDYSSDVNINSYPRI